MRALSWGYIRDFVIGQHQDVFRGNGRVWFGGTRRAYRAGEGQVLQGRRLCLYLGQLLWVKRFSSSKVTIS
jgi:hypothetical protein